MDNEQRRPSWPALFRWEKHTMQKTLFDGWNIHQVDFHIHLNVNKPGGRVTASFQDELGQSAGSRTVQWSKDRDVSDLGLVLRDVVNAFLYAPQMEMVGTLAQSFIKHCPEVPSGT
jgi:hypothetical protein